MGRELQKRKRRAGKQPVRRPPSSKKKILNNPIIRDNWNKKETLAQNYRRIGLVSRLNKRAGGIEKRTIDANKPTGQDPFAISTTVLGKKKEVEEVQVVRDPETGEMVVKGGKVRDNPLNDPLNELEEDDEFDEEEQTTESASGNWITPMGRIGEQEDGVARTQVTDTLEEWALSGKEKKPRHQSEREEEWIRRLVDKYGDDYKGMFRDRRLNVMQQSEGDIRKRVRKWKLKNQWR